ncbi:hypothetical protein PBAL39_00822 [Pedobacter sp. BAL39]|nr:hypothetical protein PBAL39_00822 [Pedobacter sp. BAL39]
MAWLLFLYGIGKPDQALKIKFDFYYGN